MKVFIVTYSLGWSDGDIVEEVFLSESKAEKWISEQRKPDRYSISAREVKQ